MQQEKKKSRLVKFTIAIRRTTLTLIDIKANEENRSRSNLIDIICEKNLINNSSKNNNTS